jgi:hypothetical protein
MIPYYELQPHAVGEPLPPGVASGGTMDQAGGLSIISSDPEIFLSPKSQGILAPVPPLPF